MLNSDDAQSHIAGVVASTGRHAGICRLVRFAMCVHEDDVSLGLHAEHGELSGRDEGPARGRCIGHAPVRASKLQQTLPARRKTASEPY